MVCPNCEELFDDEFLCVNVPNVGISQLQFGVEFLELQAGPGEGQTSVFYRVCNCNVNGTGVSHINFELCNGGILPVQAIVTDAENNQVFGTIVPGGDAIFGVPNFKIENFGDIDQLECLTFQLVYDAVFGLEDLEEGLFGLKIGGGPTSPETTGSVEGLLVPCVVVIPACEQNVTAEVCTTATVTLTPIVTPGTPVVTCLSDEVLINQPCPTLPGFTPVGEDGTCTFTVSQIICVTIPLDFAVDVDAVPSGGACGPVVPGTTCPPLPTDE